MMLNNIIGRATPLGTEQYLLQKAESTGLQKGENKKSELTVKNLIEQLNLTDTQIAGIVEVPVEFVQKIRAKLKK